MNEKDSLVQSVKLEPTNWKPTTTTAHSVDWVTLPKGLDLCLPMRLVLPLKCFHYLKLCDLFKRYCITKQNEFSVSPANHYFVI